MRLRSLHLQNIRSYTDERVEFPMGMTLLAGDVGAGKSTILLAIEFALFGIQRGELSGNALLRHGAQRGEVTLELELDGKTVTVTRRLKRTSNGVAQEAGSIVLDGATTELSAQELKARILELLNYPPGLLSKGKRPLWRYTVYTPQEEMKAILYERPDERVDTLRKLFDIDKYRRVRENALLILRELKRDETDLRARIEELERGLAEAADVEKRLAKVTKELEAARRASEERAAVVRKHQATLESLEKERFAQMEQQKRLAIAKSKVESLRKRQAEVRADKEAVERQLAQNEVRELDEQAVAERRARFAAHEEKLRAKERELQEREAKERAIIAEAEERAARIGSLTTCPTCDQPVDEEHKAHIRDDAEKKITEARRVLEQLATVHAELAERRAQYEKKRRELLEQERLLEANKVRQQLRKQLLERRQAIVATQERLARDLAAAEKEEQELATTQPFDESRYLEARRALDEARAALEASRLKQAALEQELDGLRREAERVRQERRLLKERRAALTQTRRRMAWIQQHLLNVSRAIEKALFSTVYGLFNEYFREWFSLLLEEETISVRLDPEFTPVITQDGYETSIEHLSGGEKTSVALAYRLSLNKAINEFLTGINTKGLLILDEPTDGFSSEQLDRVREVLERLDLDQLLIVSHEAQLEGYVDHVLRVRKRENESMVE